MHFCSRWLCAFVCGHARVSVRKSVEKRCLGEGLMARRGGAELTPDNSSPHHPACLHLTDMSQPWPRSASLACDPNAAVGFTCEEGLLREGAGASSPCFCQVFLHLQTCFASVQ